MERILENGTCSNPSNSKHMSEGRAGEEEEEEEEEAEKDEQDEEKEEPAEDDQLTAVLSRRKAAGFSISVLQVATRNRAKSLNDSADEDDDEGEGRVNDISEDNCRDAVGVNPGGGGAAASVGLVRRDDERGLTEAGGSQVKKR